MKVSEVPRQASDPVIDAFISASRALVAVAVRSLADVAEEVTLTQYRTLVVLASRSPQRLTELAQAVGVTPATATRMCDRLLAKGLIVRRTERGDRRNVRISLSDAGRTLVAVVTSNRRREIEQIVGGITAADRDVFVKVLERFTLAAGEVPEQDWASGWAI